MGLRVLHLVSSCPTIGALSHGVVVHRHALELRRRGETVHLALVPYWLHRGPLPSPPAATVPASEHPRVRHVEGVPTCVFERIDEVASQVWTFARSTRAQVLHYHHPDYTQLARFIAGRLDLPVVFTAHLPIGDPLADRHKSDRTEAMADAVLGADRFIVFVDEALRRIRRWLPGAVAHTRVVGHGVEDRSDIRAIADARAPRTPIRALFLGRFVAEKGIDDLLAAIPDALARCDALRFSLVGFVDGFGHTEPERLRERLPVPARARVSFSGWIGRAEVERELARADILVAPGRFESFGIAIAEAMAFGLAVVTTDTEGGRALIGSSGGGVLVPIQDPPRLADAIVALAEDPPRRIELGRRGAEHARARLGWATVADAMVEVYRELVG